MPCQEFETWVEIKVRVFYTRQQYIPKSHYQEGQSASIGIVDIELEDDLKNKILVEHNDAFVEEAWEET